MRKLNKKGADLAFPIIIFLVLNIIFFTMMMLFVQRVSSNALVYEEAYSKKIGLMLNRAEPGMNLTIDVTELVEVALKNGIKLNETSTLITINTEEGIVFVKAKKEGGFNFPYFSDISLITPNGQILLETANDGELTKAIYFLSIK
jgi:hypothetical protein